MLEQIEKWNSLYTWIEIQRMRKMFVEALVGLIWAHHVMLMYE